ncbi:MAG: circularly permuted type 2 ATP-grasp protein [Planctomycetaceae bacterium]|nr:circularly permuted type 2 ATP-grasp protein [Planctomycetaceae bacterium]
MSVTTEEAAPTRPPEDLLAAYKSPPGVFDEMVDPSGALRPAWQRLVSSFEQIGGDGLSEHNEQARRLLRDNGVTYNVYGEAAGEDRPWELDCVPLVLSSAEWNKLSEGLAQRAALLNLLLIDLYGRQDLLRQGLIPADLVLGNPEYLLPCRDLRVPNDCYLHLFAAHLGRKPDGSWLVLADRTQGPSGAGYALENRLVISRVLGDQFHDARVRRHATFFKTLRESLVSIATRHRENPRVVLLTPGPSSSAYFEDVYLARYLGYTLVEGGDLTVRDNAVFLKTLGGLLPVDVVLRRLQDADCDPLELCTDSMLGVAGLVQAARSGNVVVANALGSGILEAPALAAFLPELCRRMLGEELKLPSVATWWCGRDEDRRYVLANLDHLLIKSALLHRSRKPIHGGRLSQAERERLVAQIEKHPEAFAAQELVERSSAPIWSKGGLQPRHVALRTFVAASGDGYEVMPGGLIRVTTDPHVPAVSMSVGQGSKDLWVLSEGPVAPVSLLKPYGAPVELRRSGNDLPSRVADNMFWLGRQIERAEGIVRQWRSVITRWMGESEPGAVSELPILFDALLQDWIEDGPRERSGDDLYRSRHRLLLRLLYDESRPDSLRSTIQSAHRLASIMRDRLSIDSYRILNRLRAEIGTGAPPADLTLDDVLLQLNQLIFLLAAFSGMGMESMTRGPSWRFLDMGRRIERAQHTVRLLHSVLVRRIAEPTPVIEALLEIADSSMTYRSRYLSSIQLAPALDLVLTDESNPRSAAFQLAALADHVKGLPHDEGKPQSTPEHRVMLAAQTELRLTDVEALCSSADADGEHRQLGELLTRLERHLTALAEAIAHTYLVHAGPSRHLGLVGLPPLPYVDPKP